jgi:hypothetical protein
LNTITINQMNCRVAPKYPIWMNRSSDVAMSLCLSIGFDLTMLPSFVAVLKERISVAKKTMENFSSVPINGDKIGEYFQSKKTQRTDGVINKKDDTL